MFGIDELNDLPRPTHAEMVEDHIQGEVADQQKAEAIEQRTEEIMLANDSIPGEHARQLAMEEMK